MNVLHLTLYRKWFDQIAAGQKVEEYRTVSPYWKARIEGRKYDEIRFRNGYHKNAPFMRVEYKGWKFGTVHGDQVYVLKLGTVLQIEWGDRK